MVLFASIAGSAVVAAGAGIAVAVPKVGSFESLARPKLFGLCAAAALLMAGAYFGLAAWARSHFGTTEIMGGLVAFPVVLLLLVLLVAATVTGATALGSLGLFLGIRFRLRDRTPKPPRARPAPKPDPIPDAPPPAPVEAAVTQTKVQPNEAPKVPVREEPKPKSERRAPRSIFAPPER